MRFRDVTRSIGDRLYRGVGRASSQVQKNRPIPVDVLENDDSYLVVFDAPGAEAEDVQVRYLGGTVKIRLDRFRTFHEGFETRFPGRSMTTDGEADLPDDAVVAPDAGTARLTETGTLQIEIPKEGSVRDADADAGAREESATADSDAERIAIDR